jgi:hypothetical protein
MLPLSNYYQILQVDQAAEQEVVEAAYRRLARIYHPDINASYDATERMKRINGAYEILRDPGKRANYDFHLRIAEASKREAELNQWRATLEHERLQREQEAARAAQEVDKLQKALERERQQRKQEASLRTAAETKIREQEAQRTREADKQYHQEQEGEEEPATHVPPTPAPAQNMADQPASINDVTDVGRRAQRKQGSALQHTRVLSITFICSILVILWATSALLPRSGSIMADSSSTDRTDVAEVLLPASTSTQAPMNTPTGIIEKPLEDGRNNAVLQAVEEQSPTAYLPLSSDGSISQEIQTKEIAIAVMGPATHLGKVLDAPYRYEEAQGTYIMLPMRFRNTSQDWRTVTNILEDFTEENPSFEPWFCITDPSANACYISDWNAVDAYIQIEVEGYNEIPHLIPLSPDDEPSSWIDSWEIFDIPATFTEPRLVIHFEGKDSPIVAEIPITFD